MQEHSTLLLLAIHQNSHRMLEANMAHILRFLYRRHRIQYLLIDESSFFIFDLLILKTGAFVEFTFLYDTMVAVSLHTQTFIRIPLFVTIVAFFGFVADAAASAVAALIESVFSSFCALSLSSSAPRSR